MGIKPAPFGLAFGIVYAVVFFLYGMLAALFGWGAAFAETIGSFYVGFGPTAAGALIGALWGFVVGFVFFAVGAWLYNMFIGESSRGRPAPETRAFRCDWPRSSAFGHAVDLGRHDEVVLVQALDLVGVQRDAT